MSATYLDAIVDFHRARASADERDPLSRDVRTNAPSLTRALQSHREKGLAVIAEVKRRSPSKGWLDEHLDAVATAQSYVNGGASAISVLTDEAHFGGAMDDLMAVSAAVSVPVLRKDFLMSENDVLDAAEIGASAVLLIVAALSANELAALHDAAHRVGLDALVEVHDVHEARIALEIGATLIGVNQRDLHTFEVDTSRAEAVAACLPSHVVAVAESGFSSPEAAVRAAAAGFDAILVGEQFVRAEDRAQEVARFVGAPIKERS